MTGGRPFVVVGIEGTHGAGKSAVAHALVARLRERGFGPTLVPDAGRLSPFVQDRLRGTVSAVPPLLQELSIVGARITAEVEAARDGGVVVCDKTVFGALAYLRLFDPAEVPDPLRSAAISFCSSYGARIYDLLVLLDRRFNWTGDPVADTGRYVGSDDQQRYRELVREEVSAAGIAVLPITSAGGAWETSELIVSDLVARELV